jgi:hypothetical protein
MPAALKWTAEEYALLDRLYPIGGPAFALHYLRNRSRGCIKVVAHRRGQKATDRRIPTKAVTDAVAQAHREVADELHPPRTSILLLAATRLGCSTSTISKRLSERHRNRLAAAKARGAGSMKEIAA